MSLRPRCTEIADHNAMLWYPSPQQSWYLKSSSLDRQSHELLHHYTSTVCLTMARPNQIDIWRYDMPRIGFDHPFLLHGLLAISALHLSTKLPSRSKELISVAIEEEHRALPSFRKLLASNKPESIHAVFAFSGIVIPYILATTFADRYENSKSIISLTASRN